MLGDCHPASSHRPLGLEPQSKARVLGQLGLASVCVYECPQACEDQLGQESREVVGEKSGQEKTGKRKGGTRVL